eukprot:109826-Heterocapsa_arctica.AAC.1
MIKPELMRKAERERDPLKELPFLPAPLAGDPGAAALNDAQQRVTHLRANRSIAALRGLSRGSLHEMSACPLH